jgi:hypothetical protein
MKKPLNERLGLSVEETLERLLALGRIMKQYERDHGEKLNLKHLEAVLYANTVPSKGGSDVQNA